MINVINKELSINEVIYRDGFAESTLMGTSVILEAIVTNDGWTKMVVRMDHQPSMTFEGLFEDFPAPLQDIIENISNPVVENVNPSFIERFNKTLDTFSRSLALK